jgi:NAD(P)H-nitrite reductase large subunit
MSHSWMQSRTLNIFYAERYEVQSLSKVHFIPTRLVGALELDRLNRREASLAAKGAEKTQSISRASRVTSMCVCKTNCGRWTRRVKILGIRMLDNDEG